MSEPFDLSIGKKVERAAEKQNAADEAAPGPERGLSTTIAEKSEHDGDDGVREVILNGGFPVLEFIGGDDDVVNFAMRTHGATDNAEEAQKGGETDTKSTHEQGSVINGALNSVSFSARFIFVEEAVTQPDDAGAALDHALVMCDENERFPLTIELVEEIENFLAGFAIEIAGGFIGKDDDGAVGKCTGDGDTLLLAAGELIGLMVKAVLQSDLSGKPGAGGDHVSVFGTAVVHGYRDVFDDTELLDEIVALKDEA